MRPIKFRAYNTLRKEMVYDIQYGSGAKDSEEDYEDSFGVYLGVSNHYRAGESYYEVMQFSGLKDKNGKEVYEGDLVRVKILVPQAHFSEPDLPPREEIETIEIVFKDACFGYFHKVNYPDRIHFVPICNRIGDEMEVIGNIYQHNHLLKEQK